MVTLNSMNPGSDKLGFLLFSFSHPASTTQNVTFTVFANNFRYAKLMWKRRILLIITDLGEGILIYPSQGVIFIHNMSACPGWCLADPGIPGEGRGG
ncbi:MAG: hypothetical protein B6245_02105 [Desulfobacteraceae bacterium 4572_88]|nr:MAG: hypothetical protein B6245_02105 [Desulfobacteraceae bacterium 4572_88]